MKTEEEQSEEIRDLIVALSNCQEDTFKYKGSTYTRVSATATTTSTQISLKKTTMNENTQASIFPEGGLRRNEMVILKAFQKFNNNSVYRCRAPAVPFITSRRYTDKDPEYFGTLDKYPELKEAEQSMRTAINNSVFTDLIDVKVSVGNTGMVGIHRVYKSTIRMLNRIKAYSERYEELSPHLKSVVIIPSEK